jgi:Domain of unknown function (DUF4345)
METSRRTSADYFVMGVLALGAVGFVAFGLQWLARPLLMAQPLGIVLTNGDATSDARAVYGGMELGVGLFLGYSLASPLRRSQGLACATLALLGLGTARLIGILLEPHVSGATYQLLGTDLGGTTLCAVALVVSRARDRARTRG